MLISITKFLIQEFVFVVDRSALLVQINVYILKRKMGRADEKR